MSYSTKIRTKEEIKNIAFKEFIFGKEYDESTKVEMVTLLVKPEKAIELDRNSLKTIVADEDGSWKETNDTVDSNKNLKDILENSKVSNDFKTRKFISFDLSKYTDNEGTKHDILIFVRGNKELDLRMETKFINVTDKSKEIRTVTFNNFGIIVDHSSWKIDVDGEYYIHIIFAKTKINPIVLVSTDKLPDLVSIMDKSNNFLFNSLNEKIDINTEVIEQSDYKGIRVSNPMDSIEENLKTSSLEFEQCVYNDNGDVVKYKRNDGLSMEIETDDRDDGFKETHKVINFNGVILEDTTLLVNESNDKSIFINNRNGKTIKTNKLSENTIEEITEIGTSRTRILYNNGNIVDKEESTIEPENSLFNPYLIDGSEEAGDYRIMVEPDIIMHVHQDFENQNTLVEKFLVKGEKELIFFIQRSHDGELEYTYCEPVLNIEDAKNKFTYYSLPIGHHHFDSSCKLVYDIDYTYSIQYTDNDMTLKNYQGIDGNIIYECDSYLYDKDHLYIRDGYGIPTKLIVD